MPFTFLATSGGRCFKIGFKERGFSIQPDPRNRILGPSWAVVRVSDLGIWQRASYNRRELEQSWHSRKGNPRMNYRALPCPQILCIVLCAGPGPCPEYCDGFAAKIGQGRAQTFLLVDTYTLANRRGPWELWRILVGRGSSWHKDAQCQPNFGAIRSFGRNRLKHKLSLMIRKN